MRDELILASGSGIRRQLLEAAGIRFAVDPANIDEDALEEAGAARRARALAAAKARVVSERWPGRLVLGADQVFALGRRLFSKPKTVPEAADMLRLMSGKIHEFNCGVALVRDGATVFECLEKARVRFYRLTEDEILSYARTGEGVGCAGAYRLEGGGVRLIRSIEGSTFTVLGLPMLSLIAALRGMKWAF
jgi:septum formation protein